MCLCPFSLLVEYQFHNNWKKVASRISIPFQVGKEFLSSVNLKAPWLSVPGQWTMDRCLIYWCLVYWYFSERSWLLYLNVPFFEDSVVQVQCRADPSIIVQSTILNEWSSSHEDTVRQHNMEVAREYCRLSCRFAVILKWVIVPGWLGRSVRNWSCF